MKALQAGLAFALVMAWTSQAFATDLPDCPKGAWKHGHYVVVELAIKSKFSSGTWNLMARRRDSSNLQGTADAYKHSGKVKCARSAWSALPQP
jgi:hypothetical protein